MQLDIIAIAAIGVALALGLWVLLTQMQERQTVRASMRQLDEYQVETTRDREMAAPLSERLAAPLLGIANGISKRVWPPEYVADTKKKLLVAGIAEKDAVDRFLAVRVGALALVVFWPILVYVLLGLTGKIALAVLGMLILLSVLGPQAWLDKKTQARQTAILRQLPDILDLLVISVEAGLGFEQALERVVGAVPGALADEFNRMLGETRAGANRADAMRGLDSRIDVLEVRSFVLAILQADTFGVSIGRILRGLADEMRIKRRQIAQERAMKAPIKMLVPMVFCIFPALFVVVIGPAIINIRSAFGA